MTDRQKQFISYYLGECHFNAAEAARRAGYAKPEGQSWRITQTKAVKKEVDEYFEAYGMPRREAIARITAIGRGDTDVEVTTMEKLRALELIGRVHGIFVDKVETTVSGSLAITEVEVVRLVSGEKKDGK